MKERYTTTYKLVKKLFNNKKKCSHAQNQPICVGNEFMFSKPIFKYNTNRKQRISRF